MPTRSIAQCMVVEFKRVSLTSAQRGVTLIETVVFITMVSIALAGLALAFNHSVVNSVDPVSRIKALEKAQGTLDSILSRRFDENSPTGGVPACGSTAGEACLGISPDADYDDVGDFNGYVDNTDAQYPVSVTVINAGGDLGLNAVDARLITVSVATPNGNSLSLSAYKVNF